MTDKFSTDCRKCPRLAAFLTGVRMKYPDYFTLPVPSFGEENSRLLIVGLAPGMHGANATGRPFTGDYAGLLLYETLFEFGFATHPVSESANDELELLNCRITNAVRCLPPQNKPTTSEVDTCSEYLADELKAVPAGGFVLALGTVAHRAVLKACKLRLSAFPFGHGAAHDIGQEFKLIDSYHCSRYNTQTRRLTPAMFRDIFRDLRAALDATA